MKKIIIAYASYGGGHLKAAANIKEYIEENYQDCNVVLFDSMKYINRVIDKVCGSTYSKITTNLPWFWRQIYYHTQDPIFEKIMSLSNKILSYKLGKLFKKIKPDIIISTHFFVGHMCSILKKKGKIGSILANVITDYGEDPYNEWISGYRSSHFSPCAVLPHCLSLGFPPLQPPSPPTPHPAYSQLPALSNPFFKLWLERSC